MICFFTFAYFAVSLFFLFLLLNPAALRLRARMLFSFSCHPPACPGDPVVLFFNCLPREPASRSDRNRTASVLAERNQGALPTQRSLSWMTVSSNRGHFDRRPPARSLRLGEEKSLFFFSGLFFRLPCSAIRVPHSKDSPKKTCILEVIIYNKLPLG